jgi:hypothetical protein
MDQSRFDSVARAFAVPIDRRRAAAMLITGLLALTGRMIPDSAMAGGKKETGARCRRHEQCASGLCAADSGTCVAQCANPGESCGDGGFCQPSGEIGSVLACVLAPADLNCHEFTPCTWNDPPRGQQELLSCPGQPGYVCIVTGFCRGPEEVCLPVISPS